MSDDRTAIVPSPDLPSSEDSGLIDLRALSERVTTSDLGPERVSLTAPFVPSWPLSTAAPPPPKRERSRVLERGGIVAVTMALSMVVFALAPRGAREVAELEAPALDPAPIELVAKPPVNEAPTEAPIVASTESPIAPIAPQPAVDPPPPPRRSARVPPATRPNPTTVRASAPNATPPTGTLDGELDRLLDAALSGRSASVGDALPTVPSQRDVTLALRGLQSRVAACRDDDGGIASTRLTIEGATGQVRSVAVTGVAPAVGACVRDVVETATFPRFAQASFAVTFPYRL